MPLRSLVPKTCQILFCGRGGRPKQNGRSYMFRERELAQSTASGPQNKKEGAARELFFEAQGCISSCRARAFAFVFGRPPQTNLIAG